MQKSMVLMVSGWAPRLVRAWVEGSHPPERVVKLSYSVSLAGERRRRLSSSSGWRSAGMPSTESDLLSTKTRRSLGGRIGWSRAAPRARIE